jgi:hypothetical protein
VVAAVGLTLQAHLLVVLVVAVAVVQNQLLVLLEQQARVMRVVQRLGHQLVMAVVVVAERAR